MQLLNLIAKIIVLLSVFVNSAPSYVEVILNGHFVTLNNYPVRDAQAYLKIGDDSIGPLQPNVDGNIQLKLKTFKDTQIQGIVVLSLGYGKIKQQFTVEFLEKQKYETTQTFVFVPNNPLNLQTKGCVQDRYGKVISDVKVKIVYKSDQIFINENKVFTDKQGCFDINDKVEMINNEVKSQITLSKDNYETQQINRVADNKSLVQQFLAPIIMQLYYSPIEVSGTVLDQFKVPIEGADVELSCQDQQSKWVFLDKILTDKKGFYILKNNNSIQSVPQFNCGVYSQKKSDYFFIKYQNFTLNYNDDYKHALPAFSLTQPSIIGSIQGQTLNKDKQSLRYVNLKYQCKQPHVTIKDGKSDEFGEFSAQFEGFKGRTYDFNITAQKEFYVDTYLAKYAELNIQNDYKIKLPKDSLVLSYVPQKIQGKLKGRLLYPSQEAAIDFPLQLQLEPQPIKINNNPQKTDKDGYFTFTFEGYDTESYKAKIVLDDTDYEVKNKETFILDQKDQYDGNLGDVDIIQGDVNSLISGQVIDNFKNPVQGIKINVYISSQSNIAINNYNVTTVTDKNGMINLKTIIKAGVQYKVDLQIDQKYFVPYSDNKQILQKSNKYSTSYKINLTRLTQQAKLQGECVDFQNTQKPVTTGDVLFSSINPSINKMPKNSVCDIKTGKFEFDFEISQGLEYQVKLNYIDKTKKYVDLYNLLVQLSPKNNYMIKDYRIQVQPPIEPVISGTITDFRGNPVQSIDVEVQFDNKDLSSLKGKTDLSGKFRLTNKYYVFNQKQFSGTLNLSNQNYQSEEFQVQFEEINNYVIQNFDQRILAKLQKKQIHGKVIDNIDKPVTTANVELILESSDANQVPLLEYSIVNFKGKFIFDIEVYPDYDYKGTLKVGAPYFTDENQEFELNFKNSMDAGRQIITLQRNLVDLVFKGRIVNSDYELVKAAQFTVIFDGVSVQNGASSIEQQKVEKPGQITFKQQVYEGLQYKGSLHIIAAGYLLLKQDVIFDQNNDYTLLWNNIFVKRQTTYSEISGQVIEQTKQNKQPVYQALVQLLFHGGILESQIFETKTNQNGEFKFPLYLEQNFDYKCTILSRKTELNDGQLYIQLDYDNNYSNKNAIVIMTPEITNIEGNIGGTLYKVNGDEIQNCNLDAQFEVLTKNYTSVFNKQGQYNFDKLGFIEGNIYDPTISIDCKKLYPYLDKIEQQIIVKQGIYYNKDFDFIIPHIQLDYQIQGIVQDNKKNKVFNAQISILFKNQAYVDNNSFVTQQDGLINIQGKISEQDPGFQYQFILLISCSGYKPYKQENISLVYNKSKNNYVLNQDLDIVLEKTQDRSIQMINYMQQGSNSVFEISGKLYTKSECPLLKKYNVRFAIINVYYYYSNIDDKFLIGQKYSDLNGEFSLQIFKGKSNILVEILKDGYEEKYLFVDENSNYLGNIQLIQKSGSLIECSQQKWQEQKEINDTYGFN